MLLFPRYGFDSSRSKEALIVCDGDVGSALERLLSEAFNLPLQQTSADDDEEQADLAEITEQRDDERLALEAIYCDSFCVRIPSRVWTVKLELAKLTELAKQQTSGVRNSQSGVSDRKSRRAIHPSVCKHFLKNRCRFGDKCRFKHQVLYKETNEASSGSDEDMTSQDVDSLPYQLEVRFPPGNRYPEEAPFVAFSSTNPLLAPRVCLSVTTRLVAEAKSIAESQLPAVFTLVSLLEEDDVITDLFSRPPHKYV